VVCFNRNAALELRRRLFELVGADARGVQVQTYHGLAMRLTGHSYAARAEAGGELKLDEIIPEALRLLRGEADTAGLEPDELRERILGGYRHILVDEYQDIDQAQYDLVSAIAGRTREDADERLALLAVGDDDQNIYAFRGANVEFIRRFCDDYQAQTRHLVENYRSSGHIIAAANRFIAHNRDRMKGEHPIRVDAARQSAPPGGAWEEKDPLGRGRVQLLTVPGLTAQPAALAGELMRLAGGHYAGFAVLARTRAILQPIRALLEYHEVPLAWGLERDKTPALHRVRELAGFLEWARERRQETARASDLIACLSPSSDSPWTQLLHRLLGDWQAESGDAELPLDQLIEFLYEALAEQRREQRIGNGVFLSTVHAAKGMEFDNCLIADGGWQDRPSELETERRTFYVGMTRARHTLALLDAGVGNPHVSLLEGDALLRRSPALDLQAPPEVLARKAELLGMSDLYLDFAGQRNEGHPIHARLAARGVGARISRAARK
jgi:ATP-dependent DNA helicase RecQ